MSMERLDAVLNREVETLMERGTAKGEEMVVLRVDPADGKRGPRYYIDGYGDKPFIRMNANSYLGLSFRPEIVEAEEGAARIFGVGPGGVRFICGTYKAHVELENRLARFHGRDAAMIFSSAYVTSMGVILPLTNDETIIISDELNHNCIIQGIRLSRPAGKAIYKHNDVTDLKAKIQDNIGKGKRVLVITDGIFSMRGDHAPLKEIISTCKKYENEFEEGIITIVDDSHGVGAFGKTGRGTEEYTGGKADVLVGTLGKAFGVNGGYVASSSALIRFLRETAPMYIYSKPITVSEASAAKKAVDILDSQEGLNILKHLHEMTKMFENGLKQAGYETIEGDHPVVPLMVRDTKKTSDLVGHLTENGVLATGLNFPVVPKGDEEIRFQVSADHTQDDIEYVLNVLRNYKAS